MTRARAGSAGILVSDPVMMGSDKPMSACLLVSPHELLVSQEADSGDLSLIVMGGVKRRSERS